MAKKKQPTKKPQKSELRQFYDECYITAQKILRQFELDPGLIDVLTKKQKQAILQQCYKKPIIKAKEEQTIPKQYVRDINQDTYEYMNTHYWGDPKNGITLMELATTGLSFLGNLSDWINKGWFTPDTPQKEAADQIYEKVYDAAIPRTGFAKVLVNVWNMTRSYSRVNFRVYGFESDFYTEPKKAGFITINRFRILLTAQKCESKQFSQNNIERKAFRMWDTAKGFYGNPKPATIPSKMIYPRAKEEADLNIYIQSHVLHRFKERMDEFDPFFQNLLIQHTFTNGIKIANFDNQILVRCIIEETTAGYFTFFLQGNDIVINTFIPLTSPNTPEGKRLHELLSLSKEEISYLGMDKISFFTKVDFEQIPRLKAAITEAGMWPSKLEIDRFRRDDDQEENPIDLNKTMFVKCFLEKKFLSNNI